MIEEILNSEVKARIMKLFSKFPESQFNGKQVAGMAKLSVSRTNESLKELAGKGILSSKRSGKGYLYKANHTNYITRVILEAFEKEKGLVDTIMKDFVSRVKKTGKIQSVALFGSALWELKFGSDVDILVIHDGIDEDAVTVISSDLTVKYGFHISCIRMDTEEFKDKAKRAEGFVINVIASSRAYFGKSLEEIAYRKPSQK